MEAQSCRAELGYVIAKQYWGQGYCTAAVGKAVASGFQDLGLARIKAFVAPDHVASQRVLEKNRFTREGTLKNYLLHKGVLADRLLYAIVKSE